MRTRGRVLSGLPLLAAFVLAGCLGRSPTTEFYSLRAVYQSASGAETGGLAVGVGPAELPQYLDRPQLARRVGDSQIRYDEFHRWAGPLDAELLRVVGANLGALLGSDRVAVYPTEVRFPLTWRVAIQVERLDVEPDGRVSLRSRWTIAPAAGGDAVAIGRTDVDRPAASTKPADLVAAHSAVAGELSRILADRLRSLPLPGAPEES